MGTWEPGPSEAQAPAHGRSSAGARCDPPAHRDPLGLLWEDCAHFPRWALPYSVHLLNPGLFSLPHASGLYLPTISVTGDQSLLSFTKDVLKFQMHSLKSRQTAGQCPPSIPHRLLPRSFPLIPDSSRRHKEHATRKQEDQEQGKYQ